MVHTSLKAAYFGGIIAAGTHKESVRKIIDS